MTSYEISVSLGRLAIRPGKNSLSISSFTQVGKAQTDPKELASLAENLYEDYSELADDTRNAVRMTNPKVYLTLGSKFRKW